MHLLYIFPGIGVCFFLTDGNSIVVGRGTILYDTHTPHTHSQDQLDIGDFLWKLEVVAGAVRISKDCIYPNLCWATVAL